MTDTELQLRLEVCKLQKTSVLQDQCFDKVNKDIPNHPCLGFIMFMMITIIIILSAALVAKLMGKCK